MKKINEGLRPNDLKGMVSSMLSIDEYDSKIDDAACVIAFYANNKEVAIDLNRFMQKSYVDILDTEISAAPDQNGNYILFIELLRNNKLPENIKNLCDELSTVTSSQVWEVAIRGVSENSTLKTDELTQYIKDNLIDNSKESKISSEMNSHLTQITDSLHLKVKDLGNYQVVYERNNLKQQHIEYNPNSQHIQTLIGDIWTVDKLTECYAIHNVLNNMLILLV